MIYYTDSPSSQEMCQAVHEGTGWPLKHASEYKEGPAVVYGILRGCYEIMCKAPHFWYIDHGYFRRGEYYRIVENGHQHAPIRKVFPKDRFRALGIEIKPWRDGGRHYLLCPPSGYMEQMYNVHGWLDRAKARYAPVKVRSKYSRTPLIEDLRGAAAVVTFNSNAGIEALCEGVPVIADVGPCRAMQDRKMLMRQLAYGQWNMDEIRRGLPWENSTIPGYTTSFWHAV